MEHGEVLHQWTLVMHTARLRAEAEPSRAQAVMGLADGFRPRPGYPKPEAEPEAAAFVQRVELKASFMIVYPLLTRLVARSHDSKVQPPTIRSISFQAVHLTISRVDINPFNPTDKRTEITYRKESYGKLKRVTKGMTGKNPAPAIRPPNRRIRG